MTTLTPIESEPAFDDQISSLPPTCLAVLYFHAPWAEPCKTMSTILETLASTYSPTTPPSISFLSLDAEEVSEVSERYDVSQVPLVVLQKDGKTVGSVTGTDANKVRSAVEKHYPGGSAANGGAKTASLPPRQEVTKPAQSPATDAPQTNGATQTTSTEPEASDPEALRTRLSDLVKAAPVMLFMKGTPSAPQCGFSRQTVALLREKSIRYGFFNILADDEVRQGLKEYSDWPTFPQLYAGGELVGGLDIVCCCPPLSCVWCWIADCCVRCRSKKSSRTMRTSCRSTQRSRKRKPHELLDRQHLREAIQHLPPTFGQISSVMLEHWSGQIRSTNLRKRVHGMAFEAESNVLEVRAFPVDSEKAVILERVA